MKFFLCFKYHLKDQKFSNLIAYMIRKNFDKFKLQEKVFFFFILIKS